MLLFPNLIFRLLLKQGAFHGLIRIFKIEAIAEKYKWCCSYDELDEDEEKNDDPFITVDDDEIDYKALYNKQKLEIKELKTKLSLLAIKEK